MSKGRSDIAAGLSTHQQASIPQPKRLHVPTCAAASILLPLPCRLHETPMHPWYAHARCSSGVTQNETNSSRAASARLNLCRRSRRSAIPLRSVLSPQHTHVTPSWCALLACPSLRRVLNLDYAHMHATIPQRTPRIQSHVKSAASRTCCSAAHRRYKTRTPTPTRSMPAELTDLARPQGTG